MPTHWVDIQQNTFTRWCNDYLKERGMHINDLKTDLCNGVILCNLVEIISGGKKVGRINMNPRIPAHKLENVSLALNFVQKEGIKLVNIGPEDIVEGRLKLILGLIWTLILRYQIRRGDGTESNARNELLEWVRSKIPEYNIQNFKTDWNDGRAICALVDAIQPGLCTNHRSLDPANKKENATKGINLAYDHFDIPKVILPEEMNHPKVDEHAMMTYISYFRNVDPSKKVSDAQQCSAYGPGLVEGVVDQPGEFVIETPTDCKGKIEVKVEGPKSSAKVYVNHRGNGLYDVKYEPTEPGEYRVHVTCGGEHIPGSIFHVTVLAQESLGGEGKIIVFWSSTSSTNKGNSDNAKLMELLERKKIHERPDFEPWKNTAVDIMTREDRDAVFRRAGTKKLPIVFIDDNYAGDYDKIAEYEKSGELDRMLKTLSSNNLSTSFQSARISSPKPVSSPPPQERRAFSPKQTPVARGGIATSQQSAPSRQPTAKPKFCSECGSPNKGGKFCTECGHKFF